MELSYNDVYPIAHFMKILESRCSVAINYRYKKVFIFYHVISSKLLTQYSITSHFKTNYYLYSFYSMHFLPELLSKIVMHSFSVKSPYLFRRAWFCSDVSEILHAYCQQNFMTFLFMSFFYLTHRKRIVLYKSDFMAIFNIFISLSILRT